MKIMCPYCFKYHDYSPLEDRAFVCICGNSFRIVNNEGGRTTDIIKMGRISETTSGRA